jgi:putative tryptophan/tyrosine transport system substrate-binding protein
MNAKIIRLMLCALFLSVCLPAQAQQGKVYRVGVLFSGSLNASSLMGLRDGLKEAGYLEGKNLLLDIPVTKTLEEIRPIVKGYTEKNVDAIVTFGGTATGIAQEATQKIPIVFASVGDPSGFVKSLTRPGTNLTGLTNIPDVEFAGKQLEIFKEVVPSLRRVIVIFNARGENPVHLGRLEVMQKTAPSLGIKLAEKPIKSAGDVEQFLSSVTKQSTDGIFMMCSTLFSGHFKKIGSTATRHRFPFMGCVSANVEEQGALLTYETSRYGLGQRAAWYLDRILKGAKPQDLPVEAPTKFELIINLKAAKQIGLTIPQAVLYRADKVIK